MFVGSVKDEAREAMRLADFAAGRAVPVAERATRRAARAGDPAAGSIAERAWGRSLLQTGDVDAAIRHLRRSITLAVQAASPMLAGEARIPLAAALVQRGRPLPALEEIDIAVADLTAAGHARARAQRADILHQIGRLDEAIAEYQVAIPLLRRVGDLLNTQRTLVNRGILHTERHAFAAAEADLCEADRLARELGRHLAVGIIAENLGFLETLRGDVPAALGHLTRAEETIGAHGGQLGPVFLDRSELLLSVGIGGEAAEYAERAVAAFERERRGILLPGARLVLAQAAFLDGDWARALNQAGRARRELARQRRTEWSALAALTVLRARLAMGERVPVREVEPVVATLSTSGWPAAVLEARLVAARVSDRPEEYLGCASAARLRGPAVLRARGWYAEALRRKATGDTRGTGVAVRAGLRILDEHATALGATDLRVHSAVHRTELIELGLRTALRDGRARRVLEWAERGRASRFAHRSVLPPEDPELADLLAQLRFTARELDRARDEHRQAGPLVGRQMALERRIRDRSRLGGNGGAASGPVGRPVPAERLAAALGDLALVEYVQLGGTLHALTVAGGRVRLHELGSLAPVADLVDRVHFALRRLARPGPTRTQDAATVLMTRAASRLDEALLAGLPELRDRDLVIVPTGQLHSVPWSVLPSCAGRPVVVAPSATLWHAACRRPAVASGPAVVAAGPGLAGAREEAAAIAGIHGCTPLLDGAATADAVLAALPAADLAHLAAHGRLVPDNPLFSSLRFADGPVVVHDLERLRQVPRTVVLAACDGGRSVVHTGDELLGLAATFLASGSAQLVASVLPIPDAETAPLMVALHRRLVAGLPCATALADAQQAVRDAGPAALAAAAGFVCLGAGYSCL
jgi:tetratricopeptide (TPR) repeat protein